jgi:ferrous iron transporter FeoB
MWLVYYVSVSTVGDYVTGWTNDVLFGEIIPPAVEGFLGSIGCADWLQGLILDGIVAGVGAVLGFVPQMLVLFIFLAFLEGCGYMARVAFIMDRIFRKFGLSGKSFIPMLIGTGCGVPGIMASRTIENDRDRKMTIMTTTFIPCGAKLPIIGLIAGALFGGASWVAPSAYFIGIAAIICSGIILKKTRMFAGDPAPFVMELPAYHLPTVGNVLRSMWERGWSFIKKAGTVILLSTIFIWFTSSFGVVDGKFGMVEDLSDGLLSNIGQTFAWIFTPLGWGDWKSAVAAITGLVAKENVVGTLGILYGFGEVSEEGNEIWQTLAGSMTALSAYSFLVFNLLCAPCFAAMGAIKREMNNIRWFWFAIGYQCVFAYLVSLCIYQFGMVFSGAGFGIGTVAALLVLIGFLYLLFRPYKESNTFHMNISSVRAGARG